MHIHDSLAGRKLKIIRICLNWIIFTDKVNKVELEKNRYGCHLIKASNEMW